MRLSAQKIYPGRVEGAALVTSMGISFFGGVDPETGVVLERGHELEGQSIAGKVLVFPTGKGSTVGSYTLYRLKAAEKAPLAVVNSDCETITAVGCIIAEIPCVDQVDISRLATGQFIRVDADRGILEIVSDTEDEGARSGVPPAEPARETELKVNQQDIPCLPGLPLPEPLRGSQPGSFAEETMSRRLAEIAGSVLESVGDHHEARRRLEALIADLPYGRLRLLNDPGAPDEALWNAWLATYTSQSWLEAPWFAAEMTFYRRILEATGFYQPGLGYGLDPYREQKLLAHAEAAAPLADVLAEWDKAGIDATASSPNRLHLHLSQLLRTAVWGNQADLSMWPAGGEIPQTPSRDRSGSRLLVDDAGAAAAYLIDRGGPHARVDFLLDNVGLELAFDLLLADFLFTHQLAGTIYLHVKPYPTYVSDVTFADLESALEVFEHSNHARLRALAARMSQRLGRETDPPEEDGPRSSLHRSERNPRGADAIHGSLRPTTAWHWVSPHPNWEMPAELSAELAHSILIVSKGDANYRRWLGDRSWPFSAPFDALLAYRPAPVLAMRVLKSELLVGLPPGRQPELDRVDPTWLYNGTWGVIQFAG